MTTNNSDPYSMTPEEYAEMCRPNVDELIQEAKDTMDYCWAAYDASQRNGEGEDLDDDYFEAETFLNDLGIEYKPT